MTKDRQKMGIVSIIFLAGFFLSNAEAQNMANGRTEGPKEQKNPMAWENLKMESNRSPDQILEEIRQIEFNEIKYNEESPDYYGFIPGKIPILISAPHGAKHFRKSENRWKGEDEYTSSLAIELGRLTGAHVIYVKNKSGEDSNHDLSTRYKMAVAEAVKQNHIKFLIDLHGADVGRPFKVDIGIISSEAGKASCPNFKETIQKAFSDFQPRIFNQKFCANHVGTMTFFAKNQLGIDAAQVEINAKYRIVERKPDSSKARVGIEPHFKAKGEDVLALITRLKRMILEINRQVDKDRVAKCD